MMKVEVLKNITSANDAIAAQNQQVLDKHNVLALNIMASPGAGKTSLILQTINCLKKKLSISDRFWTMMTRFHQIMLF